MAGYLKKYVTALASAKDYVAQIAADHVYAQEALIVPFPTLAIFDREKNIWFVHIKAWLYLPFEGKKIKSYLPPMPKIPSLPNLFAPKPDTSNSKNEKPPIDLTLNEEEIDDEIYEDCLQEDFGQPNENPGRLGLFFVGNSVKVVTKSIINGVEHLLQPSDESGFIEEKLELADEDIQTLSNKIHPDSDDRKFEYEIRVKESKTDIDYRGFKCTIYVLAHTGISIISDIDDTIKISKVISKAALLKHTFYNYFEPVQGMSDLYQKWAEEKCQFHYVSASPWQLYPALRCFLEKYKYPQGTMNLRKFSWSFKFLKVLDTYKIEILTQLIESYPFRTYIFVGDSGECDPEIYAKMFHQFSGSIAHIFIRDVCTTPICPVTCQQRYEKAFENIPNHRWTIFKDPINLPTSLEQILLM